MCEVKGFATSQVSLLIMNLYEFSQVLIYKM